MTLDRPNRVLAADITLALLLVERIGVRAAAAFLASGGAGFALTCRVLQEPAQRRAVVTTAAPAAQAPRDHLLSA